MCFDSVLNVNALINKSTLINTKRGVCALTSPVFALQKSIV